MKILIALLCLSISGIVFAGGCKGTADDRCPVSESRKHPKAHLIRHWIPHHINIVH